MPNIIIAIPPQSDAETIVDELVAAARKLQNLRPSEVQIVVSGPEALAQGRKIAADTGIDVCSVPIENPVHATADRFVAILAEVCAKKAPTCVLLPHTAAGLDVSPALAAKLNAACLTGVEKIEPADGRIRFSREIFNGKLMSRLMSETQITVITVQPGAFAPASRQTDAAGAHSVEHFGPYGGRSRFKEIRRQTQDSASLDQAEVLVAAGNGIGEEANLELLRQLASLFAKSAVCGSRPVCDKNWLPHHLQVGVTGNVVSPRLYLACGVSGASQHIAGIRQAKFIVAVNKDPRAAIFNAADVCIVEDLITFIPLLIDTYKNAAC
ncbi:MAG: electron transfer flavoprotein subunit alpha/FixB family protein [Desulfobacterales bacterium]|nr:electron transfer flavoprotein subunit alpha/FixB family protein [Desulfobacterales bacterium]